MSTTRKPDPNAGALFLAKLLAEDEADRIESMSDEEFLAEQRRTGRDRVRVPTTEELLTRVKAKAEARQAAARPGAHTNGQRTVASGEQAAQANGHGTANGHGLAHETGAVPPVERLPPLSRGQRVALLLAAAFVVAIVVAVVKGSDIVASFRHDSGEMQHEPPPAPKPSP